MVENWSETQKTINTSSPEEAKAIFTRLFNASSSSSTNEETWRSIGPKYTWYLTTSRDVSILLQAYLWAVLEREVFGIFQWAGDADAFIDLKAVVFPRKYNYLTPARL